MPLIRRVECKILPYENDTASRDKTNLEAITRAIQKLKETMATKVGQKTDTVEVVALAGGHGKEELALNQERQAQFRRPPPKRYEPRQKRQYQPASAENTLSGKGDMATKYLELKRRYEEQYGLPPGPCWSCGGEHFNKHCPYSHLN